jgi:hypothetical protein
VARLGGYALEQNHPQVRGRSGAARLPIRFRYTDSATQQKKQCTLSAEEFLRRYLQHVLPAGQHRVRYFGWMLVETALAVPIVIAPAPEPPQWHLRCPHCGAFALVRVGSLARRARDPPICAAA